MGAACEYMGRHPAICQVGAAEVKAWSRCAFVFAEVLLCYALSCWCLLQSSLFGLLFSSKNLSGYFRVGPHVMTGKKRACCRGFKDAVVVCVHQV